MTMEGQGKMKEKIGRQKIKKFFVKFGVYIFLACMAFIILFPFYFMIISSLKTLEEYRLSVPTLWPKKFLFRNYIDALMRLTMVNIRSFSKQTCLSIIQSMD